MNRYCLQTKSPSLCSDPKKTENNFTKHLSALFSLVPAPSYMEYSKTLNQDKMERIINMITQNLP